ncbi:GH14977 [Drosophila grimshawi]|uniref:GH14977 n=2 Tax=Drosophila grimshawi TaxID=7222 RepID=B4J116_DROGR|nr:GH14977 [Drosophila grimshawi]
MQTLAAVGAAGAASAAAEAPDFDFQMPCRYFKSSFARSLSLNNNNNNNSISLTLAKKSPQIEAKQQQQQQQQESAQESPCLTPPPALPARRHTSASNNNNNNCFTHFNAAPANQLQQQQQQLQQLQRNLNLAVSWSMQDASCHVAAPNNSYNNLPQQQQHQPATATATATATVAATHEQTLNVEAVILQNQVDTLHWQLKQTETNCEMYRAVMEEVARFFERYQQQQQLQQQQQQQLQQQQQQQQQRQPPSNRYSLIGVGEQISRSKSLHHVVQGVQSDPNGCVDHPTGGGSNNMSSSAASNSASYLRARSSTNLMLNKSMLTMNEEHSYESIAPAGSYNAFKDFTWRRSPKKLGGCKTRLSSAEAAEEKLNQEAFRLARTIRNLLHTSEQQPDLTQPRHSMAGGVGHRLGKHQLTNNSVLTIHSPPLHNSTSIDANPGKNDNNNNNNNNNININSNGSNSNAPSSAEMLFLRSNTMRDSRLSLRSSTDSSVHSTISSTASSSSKIETDEEITANNNNSSISSNNNNNNKPIKPAGNGSSTEDESGFSSISSFHDVGLPLSSTLIAGRLSLSTESRNSTLKSALNAVGVPLQPLQAQPLQQPMQPQHSPPQQPSQSPAKTYRNANRYQRFSTLSNEDAAAVLWV